MLRGPEIWAAAGAGRVKTRASYRKHEYRVVAAFAAGMVEESFIYNEAGYISHVPFDIVLNSALAAFPFPGGYYLEGHGLVFIDIVGQPHGREASPAEFVLDTVPGVEDFPYGERTV